MPRIVEGISPWWQTRDGSARLYLGDVLEVLRQLPARSVQCVVTSPPYWGLRDYGTGTWEGGDPSCDHKRHVPKTGSTAGVIGEGYNRPERAAPNRADHLEEPNLRSDGSCRRCGAIRIDAQLGSEARPDCLGWARGENCAERDWASACHVCRMMLVFRAVRRVLRDDGTLWLNLGDTYTGNASSGGAGLTTKYHVRKLTNNKDCLPSGNLIGVPWRVALALQADGWVLRQDIIWCLSGGTWVYIRSQKGEMSMMLRDAARLDPRTVQLWNGEKWTQVLGWSRSARRGDELELVLRSGERISCTPSHQFPTARGLLKAEDIIAGDTLEMIALPQPEQPHDPPAIPLDAAWFIGLFLAEGTMGEKSISIAGHIKEEERWERVRKVAAFYGGSATLRTNGNNQIITVYGSLLLALVKSYINGGNAKDKGLKVRAWSHSNEWLLELLLGYLGGDGHWDGPNGRWRLGFARNYNWERDLRTLAARIGFRLVLRPDFADGFGQRFPTFRGEIRFVESEHHNRKNPAEVVEIRKARCREVYDVGVADDPHTFALASGILTHNCKPSPMPESVRNRCTKAHEYVFLLVKRQGYFCDMEAIREDVKEGVSGVNMRSSPHGDHVLDRGHRDQETREYDEIKGANKRSVWSVASQGYPGAHFATFPPKLIEPMILAGTSERGACARCGAPWRRVVSKAKGGAIGSSWGCHDDDDERGNFKTVSSDVTVAGKTVSWEPSCLCGTGIVPCVVLDPFVGSGTTAAVCIEHGRRCWGIDLSLRYLRDHATRRIEAALRGLPQGPERMADVPGRIEAGPLEAERM